jgi:Fic family protein
LFQAEPRYPTSAADPTNAYREVFNYGRALRLKLDGGTELPLSLRLIRQLHGILMDGVRGANQTPGEFRKTQNQIGSPARFVPPPAQHLPEVLDAFEKYLHVKHSDLDPLVRAFIAHYQFETIHPFGDGNGRVGRLLLSLTIAEWCELSSQWLYMSSFFERRKEEYMDLLLAVSTHGDWERWIEFCLDGFIAQATDTEKRCDKLMNLYRDFHERIRNVRGGSVRLASLVDRLFMRPTVTVKGVKNDSRVTYPTAKSDLKKLESLGIVMPLEGMALATYYCAPIYDIIFGAPAEGTNETSQRLGANEVSLINYSTRQATAS